MTSSIIKTNQAITTTKCNRVFRAVPLAEALQRHDWESNGKSGQRSPPACLPSSQEALTTFSVFAECCQDRRLTTRPTGPPAPQSQWHCTFPQALAECPGWSALGRCSLALRNHRPGSKGLVNNPRAVPGGDRTEA